VPPRIPGRRGPFRDPSPCGPDLRIVFSIAACAPSADVVNCGASEATPGKYQTEAPGSRWESFPQGNCTAGLEKRSTTL
jgi:hypothetical protein